MAAESILTSGLSPLVWLSRGGRAASRDRPAAESQVLLGGGLQHPQAQVIAQYWRSLPPRAMDKYGTQALRLLLDVLGKDMVYRCTCLCE